MNQPAQGPYPPPGGPGYSAPYPPPYPTPPRRSRLGVVLAVLGALLLIAGLVALFAVPAFRNSVFPPAALPTATRSLKATNLPQPTNPPLATPLPRSTNTPQPSPTSDMPFLGHWQYYDPANDITMDFIFYPDGTLELSSGGISLELQYAVVDADTMLWYANPTVNIDEDTYVDYYLQNGQLFLTVDGDTQALNQVFP